MKTADIPVYGNIACMDMFFITKIPVYIVFNPLWKSYSVRTCSTFC